jgi:hypothetical protein
MDFHFALLLLMELDLLRSNRTRPKDNSPTSHLLYTIQNSLASALDSLVVDENDMQLAMAASLLSYRKENDEEEKLAANLAEENLEIVNTEGDGSCMFRALYLIN